MIRRILDWFSVPRKCKSCGLKLGHKLSCERTYQ